MTHPVALPFTLRRNTDVVGSKEITSTHETVHGLVRFDGQQLVIQWRTSRAIDRVGATIRTDREVEAVREVTLPVSALASAEVRWSWRRWPPGYYLVLTATDLLGFESLAGKEGLELKHPAQLEIRIKRPAKMLRWNSRASWKWSLRTVHYALPSSCRLNAEIGKNSPNARRRIL